MSKSVYKTRACGSYPRQEECMNRVNANKGSVGLCDTCYWRWLRAGKPA